MRCLDPRKMKDEQEKCIADMKEILRYLVEVNKIDIENCDQISNEYRLVLRNERFNSFNTESDRLDHYHRDIMSQNIEYQKLWKITKMLLILSHGQASVERGFSFNKNIERENMTEGTFVAQRIIKDRIIAAGGVLSVPITAKMLISVRSSYSRYKDDLQKKKQENETTEQNSKRKLVLEEIEVIKKRKIEVQKDKDAMVQKADQLYDEAETTRKLALVSQANSLKKSAKEKKQQ